MSLIFPQAKDSLASSIILQKQWSNRKRKLSSIDETSILELDKYKKRCKLLESKNEELLSTVYNLRRLLKRVAMEEDLNLLRLENMLNQKDKEMTDLKLSIDCLENHSRWFDSVADYWSEVINTNE